MSNEEMHKFSGPGKLFRYSKSKISELEKLKLEQLAILIRSAKRICRNCYCRLPLNANVCRKCKNSDIRDKKNINERNFQYIFCGENTKNKILNKKNENIYF